MLRDIQQDAPALYCEKCQGEIYHGERKYKVEGWWVCEDCYKAHVYRELNEFPDIIAMELGVDVLDV